MQVVQELLGTEENIFIMVNSRGSVVDCSTVTSEFGGKFKKNHKRREF
jgi:hypothetical protein